MSTFKGDDLFGSGPHRFTVGREGRRIVTYAAAAGDPSVPGSFTSGDLELRVTVTGRLIADDDADLWALRDAITAAATSTNTPGTLTDGRGRAWPNMTLVAFEPTGPTDRARRTTLPYIAEFVRLTE